MNSEERLLKTLKRIPRTQLEDRFEFETLLIRKSYHNYNEALKGDKREIMWERIFKFIPFSNFKPYLISHKMFGLESCRAFNPRFEGTGWTVESYIEELEAIKPPNKFLNLIKNIKQQWKILFIQ